MKNLFTTLFLLIFTLTVKGQFPFEKYTAIKYTEFNNWISWKASDSIIQKISIPDFFAKGDSLTFQFTSSDSVGGTTISIYKNQTQIQTFIETSTIIVNPKLCKIFIADINGDGLKDLKLISRDSETSGSGIGALEERVDLFFQLKENIFTKIKYHDTAPSKRIERDFDNDGNFEILTMKLENYESHNYWTYNVYSFANGNLVSVNDKFGYPIMIQYLIRENFRITNRISKNIMKSFTEKLPLDYDKK